MPDTIQTGYDNVLSLDIELPIGLQFLDERHWFKFRVGDTEIGPIQPDCVTVTKDVHTVHVCFSLTPEEASQYAAAQQRYRDTHPYIPELDDEFSEED